MLLSLLRAVPLSSRSLMLARRHPWQLASPPGVQTRLQGEEKEHRGTRKLFFRVKKIPRIQLYKPRLGLSEGVVLFFFLLLPSNYL